MILLIIIVTHNEQDLRDKIFKVFISFNGQIKIKVMRREVIMVVKK